MKAILRTARLALFLVVVLFALATVTSAQDNTLTFWTIQFDADAIDTVMAIVEEFEAANPGVTVNVEVRSTDAHKEAMRVAINTPAAPDVYFMWAGIGLGGFYVNAGGVEPLDNYYEQYGWEERFTPGSLQAARFNDQYYGVPITVKAMGLYYRRDLLEQAGVTTPPTTYEELVAANEALVTAGITPLSMGGKFNWMTMRLLDSLLELKCGAETHDALKFLEANWAETACVTDAFAELQRWTAEGWLPNEFLGMAPDEARIPLYQGAANMLYDGDWLVPALEFDGQDLANYDFFPFPTGTDRLSSFTEMLFITNTSQNKDLAAQFIDFWTSPDVQARHLGVLSSVSPTLGVEQPADVPVLTNKWVETMQEYSGIYGPADQSLPLDIVQSYWQVQNDVIAGVTAPEDAGAIIQADIDAYLENQAS